MLVALAWLGRSFGIAPADRGLRTGGPYGWVRHPLYAAEILFYVGYVVAHPSWRNLAALVFGGAIQVFRIVREERILEGYAPYAARVRWRLLPLVW
jgi:protein-S-isoprenylcysteine O-methyltransferase Ste14